MPNIDKKTKKYKANLILNDKLRGILVDLLLG